MMKNFVFVLLVLGLIVASCVAQKPRKYKKAYSNNKKYSLLNEKLQKLQLAEQQLEDEIKDEINDENDENDFETPLAPQYEGEEEMEDPCNSIFCGPGRECLIDMEGKAYCSCVEVCGEIQDDRRKVCSNHNDTWPSDCELYKMRCYCSENSEKCANKKFEHLHIDYYGSCQDTAECSKEDMSDFPRRMREWLFNIMRDMVDRQELSEHYKKLEEVAEEDESKRWVNAAVWKWCELDGHPKDRSVSRHELFPLRAPLYTLEHCIAPFLDSCDPNDDHRVTLKEWANCLQLSEDDVQDMEDLCEDIQDE